MHPNTSELCLIDVTGEATEIGIVREDVLRHTTFVPVGTFSIARDLAKASGVPKQEAFTYMKDNPYEISERLPKRAQEKVFLALEDYNEQVTNMFLLTGDKLKIPKTIFLHTDEKTEPFFVEQLESAAFSATGKNHTVHPITSKVLGLEAKNDTALLLSMNFIAKKENYLSLLPQDG